MYGKNMKKKEGMSDVEKEAKMNVVRSLRDQASEMMGDKLKKVSVMSDSPEGLKQGLAKAQEIVQHKPELMKGQNVRAEGEESLHADAIEEPEDCEPLQGEHKSPSLSGKFSEPKSENDDGGYDLNDSPDRDKMGLDEINEKIKELEALKKGHMGRLDE